MRISHEPIPYPHVDNFYSESGECVKCQVSSQHQYQGLSTLYTLHILSYSSNSME